MRIIVPLQGKDSLCVVVFSPVYASDRSGFALSLALLPRTTDPAGRKVT